MAKTKVSRLLQLALEAPIVTRNPKKEITDEHIEVAIAWAKGQINSRQACVALNAGGYNLTGSSGATKVQYFMGGILREAFQRGFAK